MGKRHQFVDPTPVRSHAREVHPCLRGCCHRSKHVEDCEAQYTAEGCWGCLPRLAGEHDDYTVCKHCVDKAERAVGKLPALVAHIRTQAEPGRGGEGPKVKASKEAPVPTRIGAIDAADELHAQLARWCDVVLQARNDNPGHKLTGPDLLTGTGHRDSLTGLTVRHHPAQRAVERFEILAPEPGAEGPIAVRYHRHRDRLDEKARWQDDTAGCKPVPVTERAGQWLAAHLPWVLEQHWAAEFVDELLDVVRRVESRWSPLPRAEKAEADCFDCDSPLFRRAGDEGYGDEYECSGCRKKYTYAQYLLAVKQRLDRERDRLILEAAEQAGEVA